MMHMDQDSATVVARMTTDFSKASLTFFVLALCDIKLLYELMASWEWLEGMIDHRAPLLGRIRVLYLKGWTNNRTRT